MIKTLIQLEHHLWDLSAIVGSQSLLPTFPAGKTSYQRKNMTKFLQIWFSFLELYQRSRERIARY